MTVKVIRSYLCTLVGLCLSLSIFGFAVDSMSRCSSLSWSSQGLDTIILRDMNLQDSLVRERQGSKVGLVAADCHNEAMLGVIVCKIIYILFIVSTFMSWLLVLFLVSYFSVSILARLREGGVIAMRLHSAGLLAHAHLHDVVYVRWAWSEEKLFEISSIVLCFFVILSASLLTISRGKCHPESVPVHQG